jgi:ankyrin repeat protein
MGSCDRTAGARRPKRRAIFRPTSPLLAVALAALSLTSCASGGRCVTALRPALASSTGSARAELARRKVAFTADAFVAAAAAGDLDVVNLFLDAAIDPNATNALGYTALMWAAGQGREAVAQALVARGALVDLRTADAVTALMNAASQGQLRTANLLLAAGADVDAQRADGWSALEWAAAEGRTEMLELLLAKRATLEARDREGYTALFYAAGNTMDEDATSRTLAAARILIEHGARVNAQALDGSTPLMWAARKGELEIVRLLLSKGANANVVDRLGRSALSYAAEARGDGDTVRALASGGAPLDAQDEGGETPLIKACRRKRSGVALALLDLGAKVNIQDHRGQTALMAAASFGNGEMVEALLAKGADLALKTNDGRTAYQIAQARRPDFAVDRLKPGTRTTVSPPSSPASSCAVCQSRRREP